MSESSLFMSAMRPMLLRQADRLRKKADEKEQDVAKLRAEASVLERASACEIADTAEKIEAVTYAIFVPPHPCAEYDPITRLKNAFPDAADDQANGGTNAAAPMPCQPVTGDS